MKKISILLLLLLLMYFAKAQSKIYFGIQEGPRISFSQNFNHLNNLVTTSKASNSFGIFSGYSFKNGRIALETGISRIRIDNVLDINEGYNSAKNVPKIYTSGYAWSIPLQVKPTLFSISDNLSLKGLFGVALLIRNRELSLSQEAENISINGNQILFSTPPTNFQSKTDYVAYHRFKSGNGNWMIESGLEIDYKLSKHLAINCSGKFQQGLLAEEGIIVYRLSKESGYPMTEITTATTNGSGLILNLGLTYIFKEQN